MEKPDDLKLPVAVISRVIKQALPDGVSVSKEARTAIARAASVFALHATNFANEHAIAHKRKTIGSADILAALGDLDCDGLVEPVKQELVKWRDAQTVKRQAKAAKRPRVDDDIVEDREETNDESQELDTTADEVNGDAVTNGDEAMPELNNESTADSPSVGDTDDSAPLPETMVDDQS